MSRPLAMTIAILEPFANDTNTKDDTPVPVTMGSIRQLLAAAKLSEARARVCEAATELRAFVGVMCGHGPDSILPETITTPLGVPVKVRAICAGFDAALAAAEKGVGQEDQCTK